MIPDEAYKLCFVDGAWAFFTDASLDVVYGDDWNDTPYECNAGWPYTRDGYSVIRVAWSGELYEPREGHFNSPYCVDDINLRKRVPWLQTPSPSWYAGPRVEIWAGTTLPEFIRLVHTVDGEVYRSVPRSQV